MKHGRAKTFKKIVDFHESQSKSLFNFDDFKAKFSYSENDDDKHDRSFNHIKSFNPHIIFKRHGAYHHKKHHHKKDQDDQWDDFQPRTIDGSNNNLLDPTYGQSGSSFITISGTDYGDGFSSPNDLNRPNARDVSNEIFAQNDDIFSHYNLSNFLWVWGQFLDHDINHTQEGNEVYNIDVPQGDLYFDPYSTGEQQIYFTRSGYAQGSGTDIDNPRLQVNEITAFIDASNVYGSTPEKEKALKGEGGKLKVSENDLLPIINGEHGPEFIAGDVRANENVALTSMQTIFVREHNLWVDRLAEKYPQDSADELYQKAKAIIEAEMQHITYNEFLPALLGENALSEYQGYNSSIDPQIATEFATAAFRVGHTMLSSDIYRMQENGDESNLGHMSLQQAFFRPDIIMQGGIDEIIRGIGSSYSQNVDAQIIDDVRNFLFGPPGAGGFDLVSLNIQRGRDHGLPDFNEVREAYGLDAIESFEELTDNIEIAAKLEALYGDISNLDLWVGGLIESPYKDGIVGETFHIIIANQFERLRDGDSFWYENRLDDDLIDMIKDTTLSDVMMRNTDISHLQDDLFSMKYRQGGDDGDNIITGTDQDDLLIGFDGNDILYGGKGDDVLYGGAGHDIFVFDRNSEGHDVIRDFDRKEDKLDISDILEGLGDLPAILREFIFSTKTDDGLEISVLNQNSNGTPEKNFLVLLENVEHIDVTSFYDAQV